MNTIKLYVLPNGDVPYKDWLDRLRDAGTRGIIRSRINRLELGNFGNCKSVGDGVSECKIDYGPGYRVYFGKEAETIILLLCGGDKSTQPSDIKKAKKFWNEYQQLKSKEEANDATEKKD